MVDASSTVDKVTDTTASLRLDGTGAPAKDADPEAGTPDGAADQPKAAKKSKKKKAKREFVGLPAVNALLAGGVVPWSLAFSQRLGRHVIATRDIQPGELVLRERAVAALPRDKFAARLCHSCFKELKGSAATNAATRYCSDACAAARARLDARVDPALPALEGIAAEASCDAGLLHMVLSLDAVRSLAAGSNVQQPAAAASDSHSAAGDAAAGSAPAETAATGAAAASNTGNGAAAETVRHSSSGSSGGGGEAAAQLDSRVPLLCCGAADVDALQTHWERTPHPWRDSVAAGCSKLRAAIQQSGAFNPGSVEQLQRFAAAVNSNAHGVGASAGGNVDQGFGMFPGLSMLNHSCAPSCCYVSRGDVMEVRAVEPIRKGQELSVQYINLLEPRQVRAAQLADSKFFTCGCARCSAPLATSTDRFLEGVQCCRAGCSGVLLAPAAASGDDSSGGKDAAPPDWLCCECGAQQAALTVDSRGCQDVVNHAGQGWQLGMMLMQAGKWREAKAQLEGVLGSCAGPGQPHELHVHCVDCRTPLLNCCNAASDTKGALAHLTVMIAAMRAILGPAPRPELCTFLAVQHKLLLKRAAEAPAALRKRMKQQAAEVGAEAAAARQICFGTPDEAAE